MRYYIVVCESDRFRDCIEDWTNESAIYIFDYLSGTAKSRYNTIIRVNPSSDGRSIKTILALHGTAWLNGIYCDDVPMSLFVDRLTPFLVEGYAIGGKYNFRKLPAISVKPYVDVKWKSAT